MTIAPLRVKNLSFSYDGKTPVLEDINLSIQSGEFIGVFGPNGGGKTTLLKLLLGLLKPSQGEISLFGTTPQAARLKVGYVPQITHFDKQFPISTYEVVLMAALPHSTWWGSIAAEWKTRAHECLSLVGLGDKADIPFNALSGGQAQRALIARALVNHPLLLLLDEPTASVDANAQASIYALLKEFRQALTIVMVTHDVQSISEHAERLLCIHRYATPLLPQEVCHHATFGLYHHRKGP